jgi:hypothetical protein
VGFATDTRQLQPGQVFVALKTDRRDGHDFLLAAEKAGASAALVSRRNAALALSQLVVADPLVALQQIAREHRRQFDGPVIGISGSCGKTSTKNLLAQLLGGAGQGVLATEGNLNNRIGVPLTLTRLDPAAHRYAIVEAGIGAPGEMDVLAGMIEPDIAIITLVAPAHLQELGSLDNVAREKARLPAAINAAGVAIFPKSCEQFTAFHDLAVRTMVVEQAEVVRPAEPPKDKVYFTVSHREDTTSVAVAYGPPPPLVFTMRRVSTGMAQNAVLAICAALWLGVSREEIQRRLAGWRRRHGAARCAARTTSCFISTATTPIRPRWPMRSKPSAPWRRRRNRGFSCSGAWKNSGRRGALPPGTGTRPAAARGGSRDRHRRRGGQRAGGRARSRSSSRADRNRRHARAGGGAHRRMARGGVREGQPPLSIGKRARTGAGLGVMHIELFILGFKVLA